MIGPVFPQDVVAIGTTDARVKDHYGTGKHKTYIGTAQLVEYTTPDTGEPTEQQSSTTANTDPIKFRNTFDEDIVDGQQMTILLGNDGIGVIIVLTCDE